MAKPTYDDLDLAADWLSYYEDEGDGQQQESMNRVISHLRSMQKRIAESEAYKKASEETGIPVRQIRRVMKKKKGKH